MHRRRERPNWDHNLVANPHVTVEVGTEKWQGTAHLTKNSPRCREGWCRHQIHFVLGSEVPLTS